MLNLQTRTGAYGKEACGDLWESKRTLIVLELLRRLDPEPRARAIAILGKARPTGDDGVLAELHASGEISAAAYTRLRGGAIKTADEIAWLFDEVVACGAIDYADALGRQHAVRAAAALARATTLAPSVHRDVIAALIDFSISRDY